MGKTAAMYWGDVRADKRVSLVAAAEAALLAEQYGEARRLADLAVHLSSRNNPKGKARMNGWRRKLLSRIPSRKTLEKREQAKLHEGAVQQAETTADSVRDPAE